MQVLTTPHARLYKGYFVTHSVKCLAEPPMAQQQNNKHQSFYDHQDDGNTMSYSMTVEGKKLSKQASTPPSLNCWKLIQINVSQNVIKYTKELEYSRLRFPLPGLGA